MTKENKKLVMIGAGGHAKVCYDIAELMNCWDEIIILDDNVENDYFNISGTINDMVNYINDSTFFVAIGDNNIRRNIIKRLSQLGAQITTLLHPQAVIAHDVKIGIGSVIMAGVVINSSTKIGKGCIINTASSIDHDNIIGNFVHISPGANLAGTVTIGANTNVGMGSKIINNIQISNNIIIGASSTVINDIPNEGVYVGTPAKRLERNK